MIARNVSTKRDLITFSRLVCEFSDDKKGPMEWVLADGASNPGPTKGGGPDEARDIVRWRGWVLTVGPVEDVRPKLAKLLLPLVLGPRPTVPDRLTPDPALRLPFIPGVAETSPVASSDRILHREVTDTRRLRLRDNVKSRSSDRWPWVVN